MKTFLALGVVAAMGLASPAFAVTNLISDGDFESGFGAWTPGTAGGGTAPVVIQYGSSGGYPTGAFGEPILPNPNGGGNNLVYFSSDTANPHTLSQTVLNVVFGQTYTLSFDYYAPLNGFNNPGDATLGFLIDGALVSGVFNVDSLTPQTWETFTGEWTATVSGAVPLEFQFFGFGGNGTAADFAIDNVSMVAVPEPATWALLIAGFALVGVSMRRRRTTVSFA